MVNSIHTARWVTQFDGDQDKEIFLFPSTFGGIKTEFNKWPKLHSLMAFFTNKSRGIFVHIPIRKINSAFQIFLEYIYGPEWRIRWLIKTIKRLKPDIVHSLEFQHAGYLCLAAKSQMGTKFPTWIATNWGSDIYLFSQLKAHKTAISGILQNADYYSAECARDYKLAEEMGMNAKPLPVMPNSGGMHLHAMIEPRAKIKTSQRNTLLIKGYQSVFGRALTALKAVETIAPKLKQNKAKVCVFLATPEVEIAAELLANKTNLDIEIIPIKNYLSHEKVLELHSNARAYVGLSISDGISTSMLEAMALGAFPIQTCTSCANEWVEDGKTGFICDCDDENALGQLILRAMTDDALVDKAAELNWKTISEKAEYEDNRKIARGYYTTAIFKKS